MQAQVNLLELRDIAKTFGGTHALQQVTVTIRPGEVHAIVGENGAGKSTLIKILCGVYKADHGTIMLDGQLVNVHNPQGAIRLGIATVIPDDRQQPWCSHHQSASGQGHVRARFKPLRDDRLALDVGAFSGNSFISSWNNTGIGTGDQAFKLSVKQLYASVQPWREVEAQVGSLYAIRGETTEITNYDNDVYLTGERVTVRAPRHLIVDAITFTRAYVGDFATPNVFPRLHRLSEANFLQVLAQKNMGAHASLSGEWSQPPEGNTLHGAVRFQMPGELKDVRIRVESYWRIPDQVGGVGVAAERPLGHRLLVGGGYASIDRHFPPVNGDRYGIGRRYFLSRAPCRSRRTLSALSLFYRTRSTRHFRLATARRFDAIVTYNVLAAVLGATHHVLELDIVRQLERQDDKYLPDRSKNNDVCLDLQGRRSPMKSTPSEDCSAHAHPDRHSHRDERPGHMAGPWTCCSLIVVRHRSFKTLTNHELDRALTLDGSSGTIRVLLTRGGAVR